METGKQVNLIDTGWSDFSLLLFTPDERQIVLIPPNDEDIQPAGDFIGFWDIQTGEMIRTVDFNRSALAPAKQFPASAGQPRGFEDF